MRWYSVDTTDEQERLVAAWPDAPVTNLELLEMILDVAKEQVVAYGDTDKKWDGIGDYSDTRHVYAQLQQAINLWNAGTVTPAGESGPEGYSYTPRPLDKTIRSIIRPQSGVANVF